MTGTYHQHIASLLVAISTQQQQSIQDTIHNDETSNCPIQRGHTDNPPPPPKKNESHQISKFVGFLINKMATNVKYE